MRNLKQLFIKFSPWILDIHVPKFPRHTWPLIVETLDGILGLLERISFQVSYIIILLLFSFLFFLFSFNLLQFYQRVGSQFLHPKKKKLRLRQFTIIGTLKKKKKKKFTVLLEMVFNWSLKHFSRGFFFFFWITLVAFISALVVATGQENLICWLQAH